MSDTEIVAVPLRDVGSVNQENTYFQGLQYLINKKESFIIVIATLVGNCI